MKFHVFVSPRQNYPLYCRFFGAHFRVINLLRQMNKGLRNSDEICQTLFREFSGTLISVDAQVELMKRSTRIFLHVFCL